MRRRDRELVYSRHLTEKPTREEVKQIAIEMQQHIATQALRAGFPVHVFMDPIVKRDSRCAGDKRGWTVSVKALVGHVV